MKTLINNIELISFSYMNSNNNTINKFGIEYSYIALAINNMLGFTNNNIKNMEINGTYSIVMDYDWVCSFALLGAVFSSIMLLGAVLGVLFVPEITIPVLILGVGVGIIGGTVGEVASLTGVIYTC